MRTLHSRGLTRIEVMVLILVIAVLVGMILPAVQSAREAGRRTQCQYNLRNIGLALVNFQASKNHFPSAGTFYDDPAVHQGDPFQSTTIGLLRCPDDRTAQPGQGNLSYVVNGGFALWHAVPVGWSGSPIDGKAASGPVLQWGAPDHGWSDNQAVCKKLGVMFLGTHTGDRPWDIATTPADISDGAGNTLLVGENTLAGYSEGTPYPGGLATNWACPLPNFAMFLGSDNVCGTPRATTNSRGGQLQPGADGTERKGWARANQVGTFENINYGARLTVEGSFPFASSGHRGGANFVFCDGAARFVSSTIDGVVYARLISPAGTLLPPQFRQSQVNGNPIEP